MTALSTKLRDAHTAMQVAVCEWVHGPDLTDEDMDRIKTVRAYCDVFLSLKRPASRLDGAAQAYRDAHG